jgi:hypothetical protein
MDEIKRIETALEQVDENAKERDQRVAVSRLKVMLQNLEQTADEISSCITGEWDYQTIEFLKQQNIYAIERNDYTRYANNLTKLLRMERAMLICSNQSPDEKAYFMSEYAKHKTETEGYSKKKVR